VGDDFEHGFAGAQTVGAAQLGGLVDFDPEDAEGYAAADKIVEAGIEALFEIPLAGLDGGVVATVAVRQRVEALDGVKDGGGSDAAAEAVAQNVNAGHHRHFMTEFVTGVDEHAAPVAVVLVGLKNPAFGAADNDGIEGFANGTAQKLGAGVTGDGSGGPVPESDFASIAGNRDAVRKAIESRFEQLDSIGHAQTSPLFSSAGGVAT
jgi:hypothetical protein